MSRRNKNNSIIFLTTLSVYLGLVLVGAPAPVSAQVNSLVSQNKNVNSGDEFTNKSIDEFTRRIWQLIRDGKLDLSKSFEIQFVADIVGKTISNPKFQLIAGDLLTDELQKQWFEAISKNKFFADDFLVHAIDFTAKNDGTTFSPRISLKVKKPENVSTLVSALSAGILLAKKETQRFSVQIVAENSVVSSENNQVFIVTRLPRGSLDQMLKQDAKAASE